MLGPQCHCLLKWRGFLSAVSAFRVFIQKPLYPCTRGGSIQRYSLRMDCRVQPFVMLSQPSRTRPIEKDVEVVMHHLLDPVEKSVRKSSSLKRKLPSAEAHEKKRGPQRGADNRKSYSFSFRANVLTQCDVETNKPDVEIAFDNGIGKSSLCSWKKNRKIFENAVKEHTR